jgi:hypothetical protein
MEIAMNGTQPDNWRKAKTTPKGVGELFAASASIHRSAASAVPSQFSNNL